MRARALKAPRNITRIYILTFSTVFFLYQLLVNWPLINWAGFRGESRYIDLNSVLKSAECFKDNNLGIYSEIADTPCSGYMYGRALIYLIQIFQVQPNMTIYIGSALAILGILMIVFLLRKSLAPNSIIFALSITPGITLLFERGNIDLLIAFLVFSAAIAHRGNYFSISIILLLTATSLKFYTLPLVFVAILMTKQSKSVKIFWAILAVILSGNVIGQVISSPKVPGTWFISFGMQVFGEYVNLGFRLMSQEIKLHQVLTIVLGAALLSFVTVFKRSRYQATTANVNSVTDTNQQPCVAEMVGIFSFVVFISCYVTGISYDYRIIFYVLAINGLSSAWFQEKRFMKTLVIISLLFTTIFTPDLIGLRVIFQLVGDIAMLIVVPYLLEHYVRLIRRTVANVR